MSASITKGIILAGGKGSRLYPLTKVMSKHLLPVYDKPMIYYPLSTLMLAGIRDILIITTRDQQPLFERLLGNGSQLGIAIQYVIQETPAGLPQAYTLAEEFLAGQSSIMILGDNIYYGHKFESVIQQAILQNVGATVFAYQVKNPSQYGVVEYDEFGAVTDIIEKPQFPPSKFAVTGLYVCDSQAVELAKQLKPSFRGELEIVDLLKAYIRQSSLSVMQLCRGIAWLDAGTQQDLLSASQYIAMLEERQGQKICCVEEIAWRKGFITQSQFEALIAQHSKGDYVNYLSDLYQERVVNNKSQSATEKALVS